MDSTSTAILASDFSNSTADALRHRWTVGKMLYVIDALDGAQVAIVADKGTGFALVGARLVDAFDGGPARGPRVTIETYYTDEKGTHAQRTHYRMDNIGETIIPLEEDRLRPGGGAKWRALETARRERGEAIRIAAAEHGEAEGRSWGKWDATRYDRHRFGVTYTPLTGNDYFRDQWGERGYWTVEVPATEPAAT